MKIFLDLDGVLADFVGHVDAILGGPPRGVTWGRTEEDWWAAYGEALHKSCFGQRFWETIPLTSEAMEIVAAAKQYGELCILTAFGNFEGCIAGKQAWAQQYFPEIPLVMGNAGSKHFLSHSRAVLIDDKTSNVVEFRREGGSAFLFPRPWNLQHSNHAVRDMTEFLAKTADSLC